MEQIRLKVDWKSKKAGDILNMSKKGAESAIKAGVAEYVNSETNISEKIDDNFRIEQFEKFYHFLTKEAPEGYTPWFFPCEKKGKNPSSQAILKINSLSKGSWHHESARLTKSQVIEHIKQGYNIGISAREGDKLVIGDIDKKEFLVQAPKDTLLSTSRKRAGIHFFGWDKDGSAKINLPTDEGEMRSQNQYVLAPGSYVPFNLENLKDKKEFDNLPEEAKKDKLLGYYTVKNAQHPKELTFSDLPKFFQEKEQDNLEIESKIKQKDEIKEYSSEGKYSELFNLKMMDILGAIPSNKRVGHPLHESETDANFSLSKDGSLGHCWRHLVSLNPVQFLCVKSGYAKCEDAGTPHKGRGLSKIKGDKEALKSAYDEAVKMGLIKEYKNVDNSSDENSFILDEAELPQIINHAMGTLKTNSGELRFYGVKLNQNVKKIFGKGSEKKEVIIPQKVEALVLENGEIISKYSKTKGLNFEFDSIMTLKRNRWSLESIKRFAEGNYKKEDYSSEKVFNSFKEHYQNSMVYESETWYKLDAVWDMTTYFHDLVDKFLFIKHEGISGTAKSKGMKVSANLSFNGKKFLCPTPANFFRYRHNNKATLCIEEAERLFDLTKKQNSGDSELVEYLNGSYEKGNSVPRQNDKNINQTDEFDPAGFTRIGAINELRGALQQRSLPKHMIKAPKGDKRGNVEVPAETDPSYCRSRDLAYFWGLLYYKDYLKALEEVENNYNLANRQWVLSKPLLATARCISKDLEVEIGKFLSNSFENRDSNFDENSWERILAIILVKIWCSSKGQKFISNEELKMVFSQSIGKDSFSTIALTKLMNSLGFSDYKTRNSKGDERGYEMNFQKVCEILFRQNFLTLEIIQKKVSEVSDCQYNEDKIREILSDTSLTTDTFENTPKDFSDNLTDKTLFRGVKKDNSEDFSQKW